MGPRASPRALALLPRAHCPSPPPAPRPLLQPPTTAVGEDLMQGKTGQATPKNHQRRHTVRPQVITSAYPDLPCVSSTSSAPAALNRPAAQAETSPPLHARAPAAPSTSAVPAPSPWKILRLRRAVPSFLSLSDPLGRRGVPPAPVQSLWSNATGPAFGCQDHLGRGALLALGPQAPAHIKYHVMGEEVQALLPARLVRIPALPLDSHDMQASLPLWASVFSSAKWGW